MSSGKKVDELEKNVAGQHNTFRVYIYLIKERNVTARNVFRALNMSSPSLAMLHLDKLVNLGLAKKEYGDYKIASIQKIGQLKFFHLIGKWFVPRTFFYFLFFASMVFMFIYLSQSNRNYLIPAIVALISALINLYETVKFYQLLP